MTEHAFAASSKPRAFVHLAYGLDVEEYRLRSARGEVPDSSPYGFHHAEEHGIQVSFSRDMPENSIRRTHRRVWYKLLGFDLVHAFRNRRALLKADFVWTLEERQYLAALLIQRIFRPYAPANVVAQTVWLFNSWQGLSSVHKLLYTSLLSKAAALTVHSERYLESAVPRFLHLRPQLLFFGISLDTFPLRQESRPRSSPLRIFAAGNDPTRDWRTLLLAFGNDPRFELCAASHTLDAGHLAQYTNLRLLSNPSMDDFRDAYRWADYVVVPMLPNRYSGITVALEAVAMGVAVVSSRTGGVPTYFKESEVLYVPASDPIALKDAVRSDGDEERRGRSDAAQIRFVGCDYSSRGMAHRYAALSLRLLQERTAKNPSSSLSVSSPHSA